MPVELAALLTPPRRAARPAPVAFLLQGRGELSERQQKVCVSSSEVVVRFHLVRCLVTTPCSSRLRLTFLPLLPHPQLNILLATLKRIAEEFNVAVVLTNQVMADPGGMTFAGARARRLVLPHPFSSSFALALQPSAESTSASSPKGIAAVRGAQ